MITHTHTHTQIIIFRIFEYADFACSTPLDFLDTSHSHAAVTSIWIVMKAPALCPNFLVDANNFTDFILELQLQGILCISLYCGVIYSQGEEGRLIQSWYSGVKVI